MIVGAKALLMGEGVKCNTQIKILKDFDKEIRDKGFASFLENSFEETVLQINKNEPSLEFAKTYFEVAKNFILNIDELRKEQIARFESQEV